MIHAETVTFNWETKEFEYKEKQKNWYWIIGSIAFALIIVSTILKNYLFGFLILISAFLVIKIANKPSTTFEVEVSEHGIKIAEVMFEYDSIQGFWIIEHKDKGIPLLLLEIEKELIPVTSIPVDSNINILSLRKYLSQYLEEKKLKEPLTNRIAHLIGF